MRTAHKQALRETTKMLSLQFVVGALDEMVGSIVTEVHEVKVIEKWFRNYAQHCYSVCDNFISFCKATIYDGIIVCFVNCNPITGFVFNLTKI